MMITYFKLCYDTPKVDNSHVTVTRTLGSQASSYCMSDANVEFVRTDASSDGRRAAALKEMRASHHVLARILPITETTSS